jgi:hypothetical protein
MTITTEEAARLAEACCKWGMDNSATALRALAAERDALLAENARLLKVIAHIGEDHFESLSDAIAMALCRADGNDPYDIVSIKKDGIEASPYIHHWQHYKSEAVKIARAALGETQ